MYYIHVHVLYTCTYMYLLWHFLRRHCLIKKENPILNVTVELDLILKMISKFIRYKLQYIIIIDNISHYQLTECTPEPLDGEDIIG